VANPVTKEACNPTTPLSGSSSHRAKTRLTQLLDRRDLRCNSLIFAFLIFYRVRPLTEADKKKATAGWEQFKKNLSKEVEIVAEYAHIWGTTYNGMITVESRDLSAFHDFWHRFRETTRWYVPETRTYIAQKEQP